MWNRKKLLEELLFDANRLTYNDGKLDKVRKKADMLVRKIFQDDAKHYLNKLKKIRYTPIYVVGSDNSDSYMASFSLGKQELINLIEVMIDDVNLYPLTEQNTQTESELVTNKIFLVHGHNEEMKQSTARFIEKIRLNPIILHEQPNKGRTIIEKFTEYSNVGFAIVLLSADDFGYVKTQTSESAKLRARQNVILELGFFLGKIGRERVVVLHENVGNFEFPSDYGGVLYVPYDSSGNWKNSIIKELKAVGYDIDANNLY